MNFWISAFRTLEQPKGSCHLRAAVVTALVPTAAAALLLWLVPSGCDIRGSISVYRWTCLLPGLLIIVPVASAVFLPIAHILNQRLQRPFADGWLATALAVGILTQSLLSGLYLVALGPAYRGLFLSEVIFVPQPFVAGVIAGAIYWTSLHWRKISYSFRSSK